MISLILTILNCNLPKDVTLDEPFDYAPIIITRLERINWDALFTNQHKYNQISVQVHGLSVIIYSLLLSLFIPCVWVHKNSDEAVDISSLPALLGNSLLINAVIERG